MSELKVSKVHWIGKAPDRCQMCPTEIHDLFIDGKTIHGPWAILCENCHERIGTGLGTGRGQQYELQPNNSWLKTAG